MTDLLALQHKYKLSPLLAKLLILLANNPIVTSEMISADNDTAAIANRVAMLRLRKRLDMQCIYIRSQRYLGYWLDERTRRMVLASMQDEAKSA